MSKDNIMKMTDGLLHQVFDEIRVQYLEIAAEMTGSVGLAFCETFCTDHWRCRFVAATDSGAVAQRDIVTLLGALTDAGVDVIKTENLCTFDGVKGFALGQGQ